MTALLLTRLRGFLNSTPRTLGQVAGWPPKIIWHESRSKRLLFRDILRNFLREFSRLLKRRLSG